MFTKQTEILQAIRGLSTWDSEKMASLIGQLANCQADVEHAGTLTLSGERPEGARDAVLAIDNFPIKPEQNGTLPGVNGLSNGWALDVRNGAVRFRGGIVGQGWWGVALGDWVDIAGNYQSYVSVAVATDRDGTLMVPAQNVRVYLPRNIAMDPNVRIGDVIHFYLDRDGEAICDDPFVMDLPIGATKELVVGDPADYPSRGWHIMDGSSTTVDAGGRLPYGYVSGSGTFGSVGGSVAVALTGATISGSGTAALSITSTNLGTHGHSNTFAAPAHTHTYSGTVNAESAHTHTLTVTGNDGTVAAGTADVSYPVGGVFTTSAGSSHDHGFSGTTSGASSTTLTGGITDADLGSHGHPGSTVSISTIAGGLSIGTPSAIRPEGYVVLKLQRLT